jgi:2-iminobutanoate/2-iminopropanoate deaminase
LVDSVKGLFGAVSRVAAVRLEIDSEMCRSIGVRPISNARGVFTIITGSQTLPEVERAMDQASRSFVNMDELTEAVGREALRKSRTGRIRRSEVVCRKAHISNGRQKRITMSTSNRRKFLKGGVIVAATAAPVAAQDATPTRRVLKKGSALYSGTVAYGNLIFISGVGAHYAGDIKQHTKTVLDSIKKQLEDAGSSMEKCLKCNVYLADLKDYDGMNEVFRGAFGPEPPVRTTIAAAGVPGNSLVEIDVIAYL